MASVALHSKWVSEDGRVWEVVQKRPFGKITVKQVDRCYFGEITQKDLLGGYSEVKQ